MLGSCSCLAVSLSVLLYSGLKSQTSVLNIHKLHAFFLCIVAFNVTEHARDNLMTSREPDKQTALWFYSVSKLYLYKVLAETSFVNVK